MEVKHQLRSAADEKNLQEEDKYSEEQEIEVNVSTIILIKALQAIRVLHNFYEATSENVQLICDLEELTNYRFLQCLSVNVSTIPTSYVLCFVLL